MHKVVTFLMITLLLASCNKSAAPPAASGDAVQRKLQELAGSGATNCGRLKPEAVQKPEQMAAASSCAMNAAQKKQAFYVVYELPGLIIALAGNADGRLFSVQQNQPANAQSGGAGELTSAACPAELRIAQSGRVTCTAPGSMGGSSMGGASPHGSTSIPPGGSTNPHGGIKMSPGGATNPHGGSDLPSAHSKSGT